MSGLGHRSVVEGSDEGVIARARLEEDSGLDCEPVAEVEVGGETDVESRAPTLAVVAGHDVTPESAVGGVDADSHTEVEKA